MQDSEAKNQISNVTIKVVDAHNVSIKNLKYKIRHNGRIISQGATDSHGNMQKFTAHIGVELHVYVQRFETTEMKRVKTIKPFLEEQHVKLVSPKIKKTIPLHDDKGAPGGYKPKTYEVKQGDTLSGIAKAQNTTVQTLLQLNKISDPSKIFVGNVFKLPLEQSRGGKETPASPATPAPTSEPHPPAATHPERGHPAPEAPKPATPVEPKPPEKQPPNPSKPLPSAPVPRGVPPTPTPPSAPAKPIKIEPVQGRADDGKPTSDVKGKCDKSQCIKIGDKGVLIEELNIRLMGFGGTLPTDTFDNQTEKAVKQFQRDYMGVPETGKVCGAMLIALDKFMTQYPINLNAMKCPCNKCNGFGHGYSSSEDIKYLIGKEYVKGTEFPGMHRSLLWAFRASIFYTQVKEKNLGYLYMTISSGYRCWIRNQQKGRKSINHMGNAIDMQFKKAQTKAITERSDTDKIRAEVFIKS